MNKKRLVIISLVIVAALIGLFIWYGMMLGRQYH